MPTVQTSHCSESHSESFGVWVQTPPPPQASVVQSILSSQSLTLVQTTGALLSPAAPAWPPGLSPAIAVVPPLLLPPLLLPPLLLPPLGAPASFRLPATLWPAAPASVGVRRPSEGSIS